MIQVNELRVGNWVHHNVSRWSYRNEDGKVSNFDDNFQWEDSDWYALGECTISMDVIDPIPLTEEWLVKFGFEKRHDEMQGIICLEWDCDGYYYTGGEGVFLSKNIKHVHDLQNLVFALTGKELTL